MLSANMTNRFKKLAPTILIRCMLAFMAACSNTPSAPVAPTQANELTLMADSGLLSVWAIAAEDQAAQDILAALQANSKEVCNDLQTACQFSVAIEIYPDQASFDEHVMNPDMRGFYAISGSNTIQMVSPSNPAPHEISYEDGVLVAVHEFVHLALDEVNPQMPTWLDEGTAIYLGPHEAYRIVCQQKFPFEMTPSFPQLETAYDSVAAADLFAYSAVDFVVHRFGLEKLNRLLRQPENMRAILGISPTVFEERWHEFISHEYQSQESRP